MPKSSDTESYIQTLKPTIWVGKNGCTEDLVEETRRQLEARKVIKIKWLQSCDLDEEEILELAQKTSAEVLDSRGRMVVLGSKNRGKLPASVPVKGKNSAKKQSARDRIKSFYLEKK
ncbi:MAG: YhbY family RNA-binding protein [Methanocalculaceae archaeon]|nr:YhbY family RNA-binding protein [Methanocalculaceae archaeon]